MKILNLYTQEKETYLKTEFKNLLRDAAIFETREEFDQRINQIEK